MDDKTLSALEAHNQLALTESERRRVADFFGALAHDEPTLFNLNTEETEIMTHLTAAQNVLRDDEACQPFAREALLEGAPQQSDGYWQVPRIVE